MESTTGRAQGAAAANISRGLSSKSAVIVRTIGTLHDGSGELRQLRPSKWRRGAAWALVSLLPLTAIVELVVGEVQHRSVPTNSEWEAAVRRALAIKRPGDAIIVAPRWAEPLGRRAFGAISPAPQASSGETVGKADYDIHIAGRADLDTVKRALELSIRGNDEPQTTRWRKVSEEKFGHVALRILENPSPQELVRDLVDEVDGTAKVSRVFPTSTEPCRFEEAGFQHIPQLFLGPVQPFNRWLCMPYDTNWSFVGPSVITDLNYVPRRCIYMHPHGDGVTTIEFPPRPIGTRVVAYLGLHVYAERELKGADIFARVSGAGKEVAMVRHRDGDGWLRFEGSTAEFAHTSQPVKLETWALGGLSAQRVMCLSAQLRS
ncbi:MAG: hypothetical protein NVS3B20_09380 [Polyangiales bacterium]